MARLSAWLQFLRTTVLQGAVLGTPLISNLAHLKHSGCVMYGRPCVQMSLLCPPGNTARRAVIEAANEALDEHMRREHPAIADKVVISELMKDIWEEVIISQVTILAFKPLMPSHGLAQYTGDYSHVQETAIAERSLRFAVDVIVMTELWTLLFE